MIRTHTHVAHTLRRAWLSRRAPNSLRLSRNASAESPSYVDAVRVRSPILILSFSSKKKIQPGTDVDLRGQMSTCGDRSRPAGTGGRCTGVELDLRQVGLGPRAQAGQQLQVWLIQAQARPYRVRPGLAPGASPLGSRSRCACVISERFTYDLTVVTRWLHGGYTVVTRWLHGGYTVVTRWLRGGYTVVTRWLRYTVVTRWLQGGDTVS